MPEKSRRGMSDSEEPSRYRKFLLESYFAYQFLRWFIALFVIGVLIFIAAFVVRMYIGLLFQPPKVLLDAASDSQDYNQYISGDQLSLQYLVNNYSSDSLSFNTVGPLSISATLSRTAPVDSTDRTTATLNVTLPTSTIAEISNISSTVVGLPNINYLSGSFDYFTEMTYLMGTVLATVTDYATNGFSGWLANFYTSYLPAFLGATAFSTDLTAAINNAMPTKVLPLFSTYFTNMVETNYPNTVAAYNLDNGLYLTAGNVNLTGFPGLISAIMSKLDYPDNSITNATTRGMMLVNLLVSNGTSDVNLSPTYFTSTDPGIVFVRQVAALPSGTSISASQFAAALWSPDGNININLVSLVRYYADTTSGPAYCSNYANAPMGNTAVTQYICKTYLPNLLSSAYVLAISSSNLQPSDAVNTWCSGANEFTAASYPIYMFMPTALSAAVAVQTGFTYDNEHTDAMNLLKPYDPTTFVSVSYPRFTLGRLIQDTGVNAVSSCPAAFAAFTNTTFLLNPTRSNLPAAATNLTDADISILAKYISLFEPLFLANFGYLWKTGGSLLPFQQPFGGSSLTAKEMAALLSKDLTLLTTFSGIFTTTLTPIQDTYPHVKTSVRSSPYNRFYFSPTATPVVTGSANLFAPFYTMYSAQYVSNLNVSLAGLNQLQAYVTTNYYNSKSGINYFVNTTANSVFNGNAVAYFYNLTSLPSFEYYTAMRNSSFYNLANGFSNTTVLDITADYATTLLTLLADNSPAELGEIFDQATVNLPNELRRYLNYLAAAFVIPFGITSTASTPFASVRLSAFLLGASDTYGVGFRSGEAIIANSGFTITVGTGLSTSNGTNFPSFSLQSVTSQGLNYNILSQTDAAAINQYPRDLQRIGTGITQSSGVNVFDLLGPHFSTFFTCTSNSFNHPSGGSIASLLCTINSTTDSTVWPALIPDGAGEWIAPCGFNFVNGTVYSYSGAFAADPATDVNTVEFIPFSGLVLQTKSCWVFGQQFKPMSVGTPNLYQQFTQSTIRLATHRRVYSYVVSSSEFQQGTAQANLQQTANYTAFYGLLALGLILIVGSIPFLVFAIHRRILKNKEKAQKDAVGDVFGDNLPSSVVVLQGSGAVKSTRALV